jgi:hypothetical protein
MRAVRVKEVLSRRVIPLTCVKVPIPNNPAIEPQSAKTFASHFHFFPIPFSM